MEIVEGGCRQVNHWVWNGALFPCAITRHRDLANLYNPPRPRLLLDGLDTRSLFRASIEPHVSERQPDMEVRRCVRQENSNHQLDETERAFYSHPKRFPSQRRERT